MHLFIFVASAFQSYAERPFVENSLKSMPLPNERRATSTARLGNFKIFDFHLSQTNAFVSINAIVLEI